MTRGEFITLLLRLRDLEAAGHARECALALMFDEAACSCNVMQRYAPPDARCVGYVGGDGFSAATFRCASQGVRRRDGRCWCDRCWARAR